MSKPISRAEVLRRVKGLGEKRRRAVTCALVGHSRVVTTCFGYVSCARCGEQIGDTLGGAFDLSGAVVTGHKCSRCRKSFAKMGWRDTLFTPNPFAEERKRQRGGRAQR